jgi:hypothetical protein
MPRTATNDQAPPYYGFPTVLWSFVNITTGQTLGENGSQGSILVITNIDVVARSTTADASILIGGLTNTAGLFGAQTGSGNFDTFSWRGYLPLDFGSSISVIHADSGWDTIGCGFYIPNPVSF